MRKIKTAGAKKYVKEESESSSNEEVLASSQSSTRNKNKTSLNASNNRTSGRKSSKAAEPVRKARFSTTTSNNMDSDESADDKKKKRDTSSSSSDEELIKVKTKKQNASSSANAKNSNSNQSDMSRKKTTETGDDDRKKPKLGRQLHKKQKKEEEQYEVEDIIDHKIEDNSKYFLIRWKGFDADSDTWEPQRTLSCPAIMAKYYEKYPEASASARKHKKPGRNTKKVKASLPKKLKIDEMLDYDSEELDEDQDWEVERILDVYCHRNNKREFFIRWKGYSSKSDSWEPEENLNCQDLIEKFMGKVDQMKNASLKELRPVRAPTQRFTLMTQPSARRLSKRHGGRQRAVYYDCDE